MTEEQKFNRINKMFHDSWHNVVALKDGSWFLVRSIHQTYDEIGLSWVEFELETVLKTEDVSSFLPFHLEWNKRIFEGGHIRSCMVNAYNISYILEFDS